MTIYNFTKAGIGKMGAFEKQIRPTAKFLSYMYSDPSLTIETTEALTEGELTTLTTIITDYTDPAIYLELASTITDAGVSTLTNSTTPEVVQTYIYTNTNSDGVGLFNAIKTVIEYSTDNVENFADFEGSASITFTIKCLTRNFVISTNTIDITDIKNGWKTIAENLGTGKQKEYRTFLVEGLRDVVANYDCLWQYIISVSDPRIFVKLHAKQCLYYNIY